MHLETRVLATVGANVLCVDNFYTGTQPNVDYLLDHRRSELIRHGVTFPRVPANGIHA